MSDTTESEYYAFMRFDPDNARKVLSYYGAYFTDGPVLELASGPGVFLAILREQGIEARGVDSDLGMVTASRQAGHAVAHDDALNYLRSEPDDSLAGLFAAHFIEHLAPEVVQELYRQAARVLRPDGIFVVAVPNAACLSVLGYDFWRDPTHVRFYDPVLLQFFAERAGLEVSASGANPQNHAGPPPHLATAETFDLGPLRDNFVALVQHADAAADRLATEAEFEIELPRGKAVAAAITQSMRQAADRLRDVVSQQRELWAELGHLAAELDDRLQRFNHQLASLQTAYTNLLAQLYPPNEVFLVVRKPGRAETAHTVVERPPIEGTL